MNISYLVGGLRISLDRNTHTPGPRTHINGIVDAWKALGHKVSVNVVSTYPLLARFSQLPESAYAKASRAKLFAADVVRLGIALWSGMVTYVRSWREPIPEIIYERSAAFQSLTSFHRYKRRATRIVEVNGILSREAAHDRNGLVLERIASALERHVVRRADYVVVVSEPLKREVQKFAGLDPKRVLVVPNAVEESLVGSATPRPGDGPIVVGFMGALARWQQLPEIIATLAGSWGDLLQASSGRRVELRIIGDGPDARAIHDAILSAGLTDRVFMLGRLPREVTIRESSTWSVGVAAHQRSTSVEMYHSPLKLYEYAALGMVLLCTPSGDATNLATDGVPVVQYSGAGDFKSALVSAIVMASRQSSSSVARVQEIVRANHTWNDRAARILRASSHG